MFHATIFDMMWMLECQFCILFFSFLKPFEIDIFIKCDIFVKDSLNYKSNGDNWHSKLWMIAHRTRNKKTVWTKNRHKKEHIIASNKNKRKIENGIDLVTQSSIIMVPKKEV